MNKNNIHVCIVSLMLMLHITKINAQDIHFSQFWMTSLLQNPAMAGVNHDLQATINYKNQWNSVSSPFSTSNISADMKLKNVGGTKGFLAGGISVFSDKAGTAKLGTTQGNLNLAYHVRVNKKSSLGAGFMGGFGQRSASGSFQWGNQYDGFAYNSNLPTGEINTPSNFTYADLGAGLAFAYKKGEAYISGNDQVNANAGISIFHINQPKYSYYQSGEKLKIKTVVHGNLLYGVKNSSISFVPGVSFSMQGKANELLMGTMIRYTINDASKYTGRIKGSAVSIGCHYRNRDALIISGLLEMAYYTLGLSYDVNVSGLTKVSTGKGGFEISLRFSTPNAFSANSTSRF